MSEADTLGLQSICIHVVSVVNEVSQKNGKTKSSSVDIFKVVSKSYKEKKKGAVTILQLSEAAYGFIFITVNK